MVVELQAVFLNKVGDAAGDNQGICPVSRILHTVDIGMEFFLNRKEEGRRVDDVLCISVEVNDIAFGVVESELEVGDTMAMSVLEVLNHGIGMLFRVRGGWSREDGEITLAAENGTTTAPYKCAHNNY